LVPLSLSKPSVPITLYYFDVFVSLCYSLPWKESPDLFRFPERVVFRMILIVPLVLLFAVNDVDADVS
jgi:hypothetical protein